MTIAELRPGIKHYMQEVVGKTMSSNGRQVKVYKGHDYYETPQGLMRSDMWLSNILDAIKTENKSKLFEDIKEHCRTHCLWLKGDEIEEYAAHCLARESYKAWNDFKTGEPS